MLVDIGEGGWEMALVGLEEWTGGGISGSWGSDSDGSGWEDGI